MSEYLTLIGVTIVLTGLFAIAVASADIEEIKGNWNVIDSSICLYGEETDYK